MKIIVDAMGGDNAPAEAVLGAIHAAKKYETGIVLVGRGEEILRVLKERGIETLPENVEIAHADDVVDMHDDPANVVRHRKNSSMVLGLRQLADGEGDAFVSAGSTGALLSAATLIVKRIRGIRRAAMGPVLPTNTGRVVIIDCGANAECTPEFLLQFAHMGSFYAEKLLGCEKPRVGLLNIGAEDSKGTPLQKQTYTLLQEADARGALRFVGNVEARDVPMGAVDVVVCDGFSGNVLLKSIEGTGMFMAGQLKKMFTSSWKAKLGALLCKDGIRSFKKLLDYRETGGTIFLGITKPVVKAHGSSDALAFENAIGQAVRAVQSGVCEEIAANIDCMTIPKELDHAE